MLAHFYKGYFILQDKTGIFEVRANNGNTPVDGSLVTVKGRTALEAETLIPILPASSIAMDGKSTIPEPEALTLNHLRNAPHGYRFVRTRGTVFDAFPDETDPDWVFVILKDGAESVCAALFDPTGATRANLHDLKDAEIENVMAYCPAGAQLPPRSADLQPARADEPTDQKNAAEVINSFPSMRSYPIELRLRATFQLEGASQPARFTICR